MLPIPTLNAERGSRKAERKCGTEKQENVLVLFVSFVVREPLERGRRDERGTRKAEGECGTEKQENVFVLLVRSP